VDTPATPLDPYAPLAIDPSAAAAIHDWFRLGAEALERFRRARKPAEPTTAQLLPETFDLAIRMDELNYGCSPGDDDHASGYACVGPWSMDGLDGEFWNEPFGASRTFSEPGRATTCWRSSRPATTYVLTGRRRCNEPSRAETVVA
jgi:hypothetical protein